ncbi:hypothetical protein HMPREF3185_01097 [Porphyromonas somerae]|uniref:Uncharacterized protein n=1 Tax=Porphyromonas somerae TaxID=322095 RepID=A0A134B8E3_9PORP|nr:hypothetical protein HMPREF3184_01097 [Porphyromonadaceae bacterium KA00676]KXB76160.1 hypothetical protein HMPREF3185_01097 [Porphyromonas somerae]
MKLYRSLRRPILVRVTTYIGQPIDQYRFIPPPSYAYPKKDYTPPLYLVERYGYKAS